MDRHMILQQIQAVEGLRAENARVGFLVQVELHVTFQSAAVDEAFIADVAGQRAIAFPSVEAQVLVELVLVTESLPTVQAFEGPE